MTPAHLFPLRILQSVIESTPDLFAAVDTDFRLLAFNERFARAFEEVYGRKVAIGVRLLDLVAHLPDEQSKVKQVWQRALSGEEFTLTEHFGDEKLSRKAFEVRFKSIKQEDGLIIGAFQLVRDVTEATRAKEKLEQSELSFHGFFDAAPLMMGIVELIDDDILHIQDNPRSAEFFGVSQEAMRNRRASDFGTPAELISDWRTHYLESERTRAPVRFEYWHETPSKRSHLSVTVSFIGSSGSGNSRFAYTIEDTTRQKVLEQDLRRTHFELEKRVAEQTAQMQSFISHAPAVIYYKDLAGQYLVANPVFCKLVRREAEEVIGKTDFDLFPHEHAEIFRRNDERILAQGKAESIEELLETEGRRGSYISTKFPVRNERGEIVALGGITIDITEQKQLEERLRKREEDFRALANNIPQLVWMTDETGFVFWYNQRWYDYTGTTLEEMKGWGWKSVHHPAHLERVTEKFKEHISSGVEWEDTFPLRSKDGQWRWFLSRAFPIRDANGKILRWFGTNTDVTEQRQAQEDLQEALSARDEFLSVASHELKTPITSLKLQVQIAQRQRDRGDTSIYGADRVNKLIDQVDRQVDRVNRLVDDMLDIARIRSGKLTMHLERMDLCRVVGEVVDRLSPNLKEAGTPVTYDCDGECIEGSWDRSRLEQVVTNLLTNAMRYGDRKPVMVKLERFSQHDARLSVHDQGKGIRPDSLERIFNRFERAVDPSEVSGLGLGLFITRQIVEAHGGKIWVESLGPGHGSTFYVELPMEAKDPS